MIQLKSIFDHFAFVCIFYILFITVKIIQFFLGIKKSFFKSKKPKEKTILFLENLPIENTGYQYRAKKWAELLSQNGFECKVLSSFKNKIEFDKLMSKKTLNSIIIKGIARKIGHCLIARKYETVIVRRELLLFNDYGNLFMEKFLLKINANVILDIDDDLGASKQEPRKITSFFGKLLLENGNKFNETLRLYKRFIVGTLYLRNYLLNMKIQISGKNVLIIPTCVDYPNNPGARKKEFFNPRRLGWVGISQNFNMLDLIIGDLNKIFSEIEFELVVISNKAYNPPNANFKIHNIKWAWPNEISNLLQFDLGLMPLSDNNATRGKCGFKLIQYMGLAIPGIGSDITVNQEIINSKNVGWLVPESKSWVPYLRDALMRQEQDLLIMGQKARHHIEKHFSFSSHIEKYINFIDTNKHE